VRAAAGCNVDSIRGAQGTARPTVAQRFIVFMRDNCFAINPLPEPTLGNAGFIRQNRDVCRAPPDKSGVPPAHGSMLALRAYEIRQIRLHSDSHGVEHGTRSTRTQYIRYPKLFTVGQASSLPSWPGTTVNNFVAARDTCIKLICRAMDSDVSIAPVSRPGGPSLRTHSRSNDSDLIDRPAGRGLALKRLLKRASLEPEDDSPILMSPGQACGKPTNRSNQTHA
jgi:hypothetical protein